MMINAWKLMGDAAKKPAWANVQKSDFYEGGGFSVTKTTPYGIDARKTEYGTEGRPSNKPQPATSQTAGSSSWPVEAGPNNISGSGKKDNPQKDFSYSEKQLLELFSSKIASRGSRGIFGLAKSFKIFDDNRSGDLDEVEFTKAVKDIRINITTKDI